ncbi:uncharacterized protein J3R85_004523 [Psidium guajava]|nr:uncharacterized protein J3R85_004523 [Psidium guajava]
MGHFLSHIVALCLLLLRLSSSDCCLTVTNKVEAKGMMKLNRAAIMKGSEAKTSANKGAKPRESCNEKFSFIITWELVLLANFFCSLCSVVFHSNQFEGCCYYQRTCCECDFSLSLNSFMYI